MSDKLTQVEIILAQLLNDMTGSCPLDQWDIGPWGDCDEVCENLRPNEDYTCWIQFARQKS